MSLRPLAADDAGHRIEVNSQSRSYPVLIGRGNLARLGFHAREQGLGRRCVVITDANVAPLHGASATDSLRASGFEPELVVFPAGEASKSLSEAGRICDEMVAAGLDRRTFVVALGGGVVGDLAGFVAAIFFRGVPCVQVPTTVLAQVDSAIGGKTAVNTVKAKNLLGAFLPPCFVLVDVSLLDTLPKHICREGLAEVVKHAVIRDRRLFEHLTALRVGNDDLLPVVRRSLEIKAQVVSEDEFELKGLRALLNFGHTIGHAIEQAAGYGGLLHGEAVSLGMVAATRLSVEKAGLSEPECARIISLLAQFHLPTTLPGTIATEAVIESMAHDKKFEEGRVRFVLIPKLGEAFLSEAGQVAWPDLRRMVEGLR